MLLVINRLPRVEGESGGRERDRERESARGRVNGRGGTTALALRLRTGVWSVAPKTP